LLPKGRHELISYTKTTTSKAIKNDKGKLYSENGKFFANRAMIVHQSSYSSSQVEDDEDE
jgi:hypothetical protein